MFEVGAWPVGPATLGPMGRASDGTVRNMVRNKCSGPVAWAVNVTWPSGPASLGPAGRASDGTPRSGAAVSFPIPPNLRSLPRVISHRRPWGIFARQCSPLKTKQVAHEDVNQMHVCTSRETDNPYKLIPDTQSNGPDKMPLPTCRECNLTIQSPSDSIEVGGAHYHQHCFTCTKCQKVQPETD
jgi:hypothetical protein